MTAGIPLIVRKTGAHLLRLRAVALALRVLWQRAVALALRVLWQRAVALALRVLWQRAVALALRGAPLQQEPRQLQQPQLRGSFINIVAPSSAAGQRIPTRIPKFRRGGQPPLNLSPKCTCRGA